MVSAVDSAPPVSASLATAKPPAPVTVPPVTDTSAAGEPPTVPLNVVVPLPNCSRPVICAAPEIVPVPPSTRTRPAPPNVPVEVPLSPLLHTSVPADGAMPPSLSNHG